MILRNSPSKELACFHNCWLFARQEPLRPSEAKMSVWQISLTEGSVNCHPDGCDNKLHNYSTSICLSMLCAMGKQLYQCVYIMYYIRTIRWRKGWADCNERMSIKVCSKLRLRQHNEVFLLYNCWITWQLKTDTSWRILAIFPGETACFELQMEMYPRRIWDHPCLICHPWALKNPEKQILLDLRCDPKSK